MTITGYIQKAPKEGRAKLRAMRACIKKAAPGVREEIKWGMPAFCYKRILVMFAGFKHHVGFFPTGSAVKAFSKELKKFKTGRGSIQLPYDKPLPLPLIRRITAYRLRELKAKDIKWRA